MVPPISSGGGVNVTKCPVIKIKEILLNSPMFGKDLNWRVFIDQKANIIQQYAAERVIGGWKINAALQVSHAEWGSTGPTKVLLLSALVWPRLAAFGSQRRFMFLQQGSSNTLQGFCYTFGFHWVLAKLGFLPVIYLPVDCIWVRPQMSDASDKAHSEETKKDLSDIKFKSMSCKRYLLDLSGKRVSDSPQWRTSGGKIENIS